MSLWRRMMTCVVKGCKKPRDFQGHHIISQGSGGSDGRWNRLGVCRVHHTEIEAIGEAKFIVLHPEVKKFIERAHRVERVWGLMQAKIDPEDLAKEDSETVEYIEQEVKQWKRIKQ